jgi:hypothetical protein
LYRLVRDKETPFRLLEDKAGIAWEHGWLEEYTPPPPPESLEKLEKEMTEQEKHGMYDNSWWDFWQYIKPKIASILQERENDFDSTLTKRVIEFNKESVDKIQSLQLQLEEKIKKIAELEETLKDIGYMKQTITTTRKSPKGG